MKRGFTLIELIVVIIIVGVLAAVGISQYSVTVEKSRVAEAKVRIGAMKQLAYEYYLNNGTYVGITSADAGGDTCHTTDYYSYIAYSPTDTNVYLRADRCTSGGKSPQHTFYGLIWALNSSGVLSQYAYYSAALGAWVYSSDWGPCCR